MTRARPSAAGVPLPKNNFATGCKVTGIAEISLCIYMDLKGVRVRVYGLYLNSDELEMIF